MLPFQHKWQVFLLGIIPSTRDSLTGPELFSITSGLTWMLIMLLGPSVLRVPLIPLLLLTPYISIPSGVDSFVLSFEYLANMPNINNAGSFQVAFYDSNISLDTLPPLPNTILWGGGQSTTRGWGVGTCSIPSLIIACTFLGSGVGMLAIICPMYVVENTPPDWHCEFCVSTCEIQLT